MFTVLWDNDGVLVDTEGLYFRASQQVLETVGVCLTREQFIEISLRRGESTFQLAAQRGVPVEEIARLRTQRDRVYADLLGSQSCVVEGAEEALRSLYGLVRMGVVTSSRRTYFDIAHASGVLMRYLDFVVSHEDYRHSKPHPEPYLTAIDRYRLAPEACVVIEDTQRGLVSATAAGLRCMVVLTEWTRNGDFRIAHKVLDRISAVPGEVLKLAGAANAGLPEHRDPAPEN
jgi:HAD superfamily hydrolase (TIGR01509 family)